MSREEIGSQFCQALNADLVKSCKAFEEKVLFAERGFEITENAGYFFANFSDQLRFAVYTALDVLERSALVEAGKNIAVGVVRAGAGYYLLGDNKAGIAFQGINALLTHQSATGQLNDLSQLQSKAEKILSFLGDSAKKSPGEMVNRLAIRFWQQFRLHIELLKKGEAGSDILIEYLTTQIINSIIVLPKKMLDSDIDGVLNHIYKDVLSKVNESKKNLKLQTQVKELKWNLKGLIGNSPRVYCESYSMPGSSVPLFKFEMYSRDDKKRKKLKEVSADDSHKYPAVMLLAKSDLDRLPNFASEKHYERKFPSVSERNENKFHIHFFA